LAAPGAALFDLPGEAEPLAAAAAVDDAWAPGGFPPAGGIGAGPAVTVYVVFETTTV
jgi:hypothetical protein